MEPRNTDALTIRNHPSRDESGLPNQGQIDWIALANTTVSASVGFLSRMSNAGVDPFTVAVGQAVASKFRMSMLGLHRIDTAIKSLRYASGMGEAMWFGFGINHIIRTLSLSTEGVTCIMLCSALSETRTTAISARVLFELADTYSSSSPDAARLTPSLQQWETLVKVSAGCLSSTDFGVVVDQMVKLVYHRKTNSLHESHRPLIGNTKDVALVLNAIGRLSTGHITALTVSGGCDCGWIAAMAYWFFDIAVEVRDKNGRCIYPYSKPAATPQRILIILQSSPSSNALQAVGEAYTVANIAKEVIYKDDRHSLLYNVQNLQTRVPWQSMLSQVFGKQASRLLRLTIDLGTAVGSAARIFMEFTRLQPRLLNPGLLEYFIGTNFGRNWFAFGPASYGLGLIHVLCTTLPETASVRNIMEDASRTSFVDAIAGFQASQERLKSVCKCPRCNSSLQVAGELPTTLLTPCLQVLCVFIIRLAHLLSVTALPPPLLPSRSGLEEYYLQIEAIMMSIDMKHLGRSDDGLYLASAQNDLSTIFTGYRETAADQEQSAFVKQGICFYMGILCRLSDIAEELACLYIIPGIIEGRTGRTYDIITDSAEFKHPVFDYVASPAKRCRKLPVIPHLSKESFEVSAVVEETLTDVSIHFIIRSSSRNVVKCTPMVVLQRLLRAYATTRSPCTKQGCPDLNIGGLPIATIEGEGEFNNSSLAEIGCKIGIRLVGSNPIARVLGLLVSKRMEPNRPTGRSSLSGKTSSKSSSNSDESDDSSASDHRIDSPPDVLDNVDHLETIEAIEACLSNSLGREESPDWESAVKVMIQRDECLPCMIRKAVGLSQFLNIYIICK